MAYTDADLAAILRNPDISADDDRAHAKPTQAQSLMAQVGIRSEHDLQAAIMAEVNRLALGDDKWARLFAVPNGGQRSAATAGRLKAEGVRAGVPDLLWPLRRHNYVGLAMELKVGRNAPTTLQMGWLEWLGDNGWYACVIRDDPAQALHILKWYCERVEP